MIRYGYWLPMFGGWLRNVDDERMEASWRYVRDLAVRSEQIGYDIINPSNGSIEAQNLLRHKHGARVIYPVVMKQTSFKPVSLHVSDRRLKNINDKRSKNRNEDNSHDGYF